MYAKQAMKAQRTAVKRLAASLGIFLVAVFAGCINPETAARSPKAELLQDAERYALDLKAQDKLPGYSSKEHGKVIASAPWNGGNVSYPASVTVRAWKQGDETTYCYAFVKNSPVSIWHLSQATHLDKHDNVLEQLYPK